MELQHSLESSKAVGTGGHSLSTRAIHQCSAWELQDAGPALRGLLGLLLVGGGAGPVLLFFGSIKDGDVPISPPSVPVRGRGKPVGFECEKPRWEWDRRGVGHLQPALGSQDTSPSSPDVHQGPAKALYSPPQDRLCPTPAFCAGLCGSSRLLCRQEGALQLTLFSPFFPPCSPTEAAWPGYLCSTREKGTDAVSVPRQSHWQPPGRAE